MNLFFRLLRVFITALFSKKNNPILKPVSRTYRVWITDQDMFAHMTNSRYLSFSDLGTINYIIRSGTWAVLREMGWFPVICGQTMAVARMLRFPHKFKVTTRITGWNEKYVGLLHEFSSRGRTTAQVKVVARFASNDRKQVNPQSMVDILDPETKNPGLAPEYLSIIDQIEDLRTSKK